MRNNITELLKGVEVEWKTLGEVAKITIGEFIHQNNQAESAKYPVYNGGISPTGYYNNFNNRGHKIIVSARGANAGFVNRISKPYWAGNSCYSIGIKDYYKLNWIFVYYFLKENEKNLIGSQQKGSIPSVSKKQMEKFQIPIPPLYVQTEIARILDTFTALTAELITELTAELAARKKQYNYYRDKLLTFKKDDEVEWKPLGEILHRTKGTKITASKMKEIHKNNAPLKIFAGGKTFALVNFEDIPEKDINQEPSIIVKSRGIIEFEYYDKPFSHKNEMWSYHSQNEQINIKYVYYFLKTKELYFQNIGSKMQMPQIATPDTDKFIIPIPSYKIQNRIVKILDKFDALTNSITESLPREIELRQKQYEYYRNLLLDFPKVQES
ncbi:MULTISPECIES: restriction endonuclease subunit S [unclassified Gilliamella]|uniref:restriction endonuclease subunit S n=1 Tax=unclassified Gilliamella TaxID=2685620 RepID=UPI001923DD77|nr:MULTISPECIES: restriction endonuclease subunit S [unclassified Gilliamella]